MKNLKPAITSLLVLMIFSVFLTSCGKEKEVIDIDKAPLITEQLQQELESDPLFLEFQQLNTLLFNEVKRTMQKKGFTGEDLKNIYTSRNEDQIKAFFQNTKLVEIMNEVTPIAEQLNNRYSDLLPTDYNFEKSAMNGFENLNPMASSNMRGCSWRYWVCSGGAWSGLVACTIGTSGWGIFFCNLAYYAALALCTDSYC